MKSTVIAAAAAAFVLFAGAEFMLLAGGHGEFWWSHLYGFFALFGLAACLGLIFFGKAVVGRCLQRRENYYGREESDA